MSTTKFTMPDFPNFLIENLDDPEMREATIQAIREVIEKAIAAGGYKSAEDFAIAKGFSAGRARTIRRILSNPPYNPGIETVREILEKIGYGLVLYRKD